MPPAAAVELLDQSIVSVLEYLESYNADLGVWPRQIADPAAPTSRVLFGSYTSTATGGPVPQCNKPMMGQHGEVCLPPATFVYHPAGPPNDFRDRIGIYYYAIVDAKAAGVPRATIDRMVAWARAIWPATDWSAL